MTAPHSNKADLLLLRRFPEELMENYGGEIDAQTTRFAARKPHLDGELARLKKFVGERLLAEMQKLANGRQPKSTVGNLIRVHVMEFCNDFEDLLLADRRSPQLVVKYQGLIAAIAHKFINNGSMEENHKEDAVQMVNESLLKKLNKGKLLQFRGETLFKHFFVVVVANTLRDALRKIRNRRKPTLELNPEISEAHASNEASGAFGDCERHLSTLRVALKLFPKPEKDKLEFSLHVLYCITLTPGIVRRYYPYCNDSLLVEILSEFGKPYGSMPKGELFRLLNGFLNELGEDAKPTQPDALRKWFVKSRALVWSNLFGGRAAQLHAKELDIYFETLVHKHFA